VKQSVKVLTNISFIFDKIERDGNLAKIEETFKDIIDKEIGFAIEELSKLEKKSKKFNMQSQLRNNTYIFKENLKLLTEFVSRIISRSNLER
jgi:hypothetical protein